LTTLGGVEQGSVAVRAHDSAHAHDNVWSDELTTVMGISLTTMY